MPSSAKTRFNNDYEKLLFFTKKKKYFFTTQYEPLKSTPPKKRTNSKKTFGKYLSAEQEALARQGMTKKRGEKIVMVRKNLPSQNEFVSFIRSRTNIDTIVENSQLKRSKVEHWFRKDNIGFSYPSVDDWNEIKWILDDWSEEFNSINQRLTDVTFETDDILKNAHKGRIKRAVWSINTKAFKGYHYASYPEELVKTPILACTSEGDIVLDPFSGSGTTAVVAAKHNRKYIGMDLNESYVNISKKRIAEAQISVTEG